MKRAKVILKVASLINEDATVERIFEDAASSGFGVATAVESVEYPWFPYNERFVTVAQELVTGSNSDYDRALLDLVSALVEGATRQEIAETLGLEGLETSE